eukprot:3751659-Prymnesium_polylepis.1
MQIGHPHMAAERAPPSPVIESPAGRGYAHVLSKWVREQGETIMMMAETNVAEVAAGRISERVVAAARENTVPESAVLMDDGATCNIRTTAQGQGRVFLIPGATLLARCLSATVAPSL